MSDDREAAIRALLPAVRQLARRVHRMVPSADVDDLVGDGCVGLIRAVDAFDPMRGVPLGTVCTAGRPRRDAQRRSEA